MKKLMIFLIFFALLGCNSIIKNKQTSDNFNCPRVFFSSEDRIFVDAYKDSTLIDDVTLKAELNNFALTKKCYKQNKNVIIPIDILIIAEPTNNLKNPNVSIPLYAILFDQNG